MGSRYRNQKSIFLEFISSLVDDEPDGIDTRWCAGRCCADLLQKSLLIFFKQTHLFHVEGRITCLKPEGRQAGSCQYDDNDGGFFHTSL